MFAAIGATLIVPNAPLDGCRAARYNENQIKEGTDRAMNNRERLMNHMLLKNARVYQNGAFAEANILCLNGTIEKIGRDIGDIPEIPIEDGTGLYAVPGFIDVHTHGAVGVDVNEGSADGLKKIAAFFASQGVTAWNASVLTDTEAQTVQAIRAVKAVMEESGYGARLLGVHLEGPFLNPDYKGAMPEWLLRKGDRALAEQYAAEAGEALRYITVAPEVEGVAELIPFLRKHATVALGHSGASYEESRAAIEAGARAITHTFNGMALFHQHRPGLMGAALETDVYCEAICDGLHLHPGTVRMLLKCKGWDRVVAITDSIMAAGLPDGQYKLGVNDVIVENGDARLAVGSSRAGSTLTMIRALRNILAFTGAPLEKALPLLTENPARLLGIDGRTGSLAPGKDADIVLLDSALRVRATYVAGQAVYLAR